MNKRQEPIFDNAFSTTLDRHTNEFPFSISNFHFLSFQKRKEIEDKEDPKPSKKAKISGAVPESPSSVPLNALLPLSVAASGKEKVNVTGSGSS